MFTFFFSKPLRVEPDMPEFHANPSDPFGKLLRLHFRIQELERMILFVRSWCAMIDSVQRFRVFD